jgi:uncharacterized protein YebE (UPF0316 family)
MSEDPLKAAAYCLAFVIGINPGILIENKLTLGLAQIEVIAECQIATEIADKLRGNGYGVTTFDCVGLMGKKQSLNIKILRKDVAMTVALLKEYEHLPVTITDIREVPAGIIEKKMLKIK